MSERSKGRLWVWIHFLLFTIRSDSNEKLSVWVAATKGTFIQFLVIFASDWKALEEVIVMIP